MFVIWQGGGSVLNTVLNEGFTGMQQSQKKMLQAAQDIVRAGLPRDQASLNPSSTGATPVTDAGAATNDVAANQAVEANGRADRSTGGYSASQGDIVEPLIEQKRQQLLFDASASVVKTASETLGTLIDDLS